MHAAVPLLPQQHYKTLEDVPEEIWEAADRPEPGYQAETTVRLAHRPVPCLIDPGASCAGCPAEVLLQALNDTASLLKAGS